MKCYPHGKHMSITGRRAEKGRFFLLPAFVMLLSIVVSLTCTVKLYWAFIGAEMAGEDIISVRKMFLLINYFTFKPERLILL